MDYQSLIESLTPEIVARLRVAVETGRWPDGRTLTSAQREHSLQAIIAWEQRHLTEEERVGFIDTSKKQAGRTQPSTEESLRWVSDTNTNTDTDTNTNTDTSANDNGSPDSDRSGGPSQ